MGSCENSLAGVEVVPEPLRQTSVQQQRQLLPCLEEDGLGMSNGNVGPAEGSVRLKEKISLNDSAGGGGSSVDFLKSVSVVDEGISLVCENGNAVGLVLNKLSEDECGIVGDNLNEKKNGIIDCSTEASGLCGEKMESCGKNCGLANSLENCEQSLPEVASVDKGIGLVCENGNAVSLVSGRLSEEEHENIGNNLNERQIGTDDCFEETDGLDVEKVGSRDQSSGLVNSQEDCDQCLELMHVSDLLDNRDEQDQQKDGIDQEDFEDKSDGLAATVNEICDQMGPSLYGEVSAELRPMSASPRNEVEQDKQQGNSTSLERIFVVTEKKSVSVAGMETDDHNHGSMPQLIPITDTLGNFVQQDDQTINIHSAAEELKSDNLSAIEATVCNHLISHQVFDKSLELIPPIGSPEKNVQEDERKFDWPVNPYCDTGGPKTKNDLLAMEKTIVHNQTLSLLVDKRCMESDSSSGTPGSCCQQNDLKTKPASSMQLGRAVDGTSDALDTLDSDACTQQSLQRTEIPKELSVTGFLVSNCDRHNYQGNDRNVNCGTAESVPTSSLEKRDLKGCIEACPSQACQRTLENLAMNDSFDYSDQKNEQRDDKSVNCPFVESKPDVMEEGIDVTTEIKVEISCQQFSVEGDAHDFKECSPKIALTCLQSCQAFGVRELDVANHGKADFSAILSGDAADCSEQMNSGVNDLAINDNPPKTICPDIGSSSSRRSSRTCKFSKKPQTKRASRKCRNKDKVQELLIFKAERKKRSCSSKLARSSYWGLLGNITQFFEQSNGLGLNEIQNHEPSQKKAGRRGGKQNKSRAGGNSQRSCAKKHTSTGGIRLRVKVGNEVLQNGLNITVPEVIDTPVSAGAVVSDFETKSYQGTRFEDSSFTNCAEVKAGEEETEEQLECFDNKLEEARIHSDTSVSDFHVANKGSEDVAISQKSSRDAEADYLGVPSHVEVEALDAITEKRYTDPGTSPDSEVINSVPEGQVNTRCEEDFPVAPAIVSINKKGKKKGKATHASDFFPEDKSPGVASLNKATKNRGSRQRKGDKLFSSEMLTSLSATNASSNSSISRQTSEEQLPFLRETEVAISKEDLPDELSKETRISSSLDVGLKLSEPQNLSNLLPSTKFKGCQLPRKSDGARKGGSKVFDKAKSKKENGCRERKKERKSVKKKKVKGKIECNDSIYKEKVDLEIGNCIVDETEQSNPHDDTASMAVMNLDMASVDAVKQHLPVDNAWVRCDECHKWRRIPVAFVDSIGQTNCQWICKENTDKAFADCSIPQEKSNAEINAELGLSDGDEDACDVPSKNKGLEHKRTTVSKEHEFTRISTNQFLHRSRKTQTIDEIMVCHCKLRLDGGLGCGDECLNRMLNIECVRGTCLCGDRCSNQQFQKRNYAKMKWDRCGKKGFGLRLEEDISKGQFLIEYVGEVLDLHAYEARQREYALKGHKHFYFMTLNGSEVIDACAKGNLGRFINHSCDPNCRTEKWVVNGEICIGLFALRDIKKGEEVTFDYNYVRVCGAAAKKCYCGSLHCRGYIGSDPTNTEIIDQVDSDEEFLEPVMLEVGEAGDRIKNKISRASSFDDVELQVPGSISNNRDKMDNSTTATGKMEVATEIEDSTNPSTSSISQLHSLSEMGNLKPSSSQQADDATIESLPAVKQEISIEELQKLETSSATMLSKPSSDVMVANRKPKSEEKRVFVKSRFLIKTSRESGGAKNGKFTNNSLNFNKVQMMANKSQVLSTKPKKLMDATSNGRFEAVEGKLNELLDTDGGISKRKDAAKGYLKFLLLTAASGASGNGEAIQSNRDLSMILDALLKTKSRVVLIDIINKNGLRMLHNMLKQYRSDFKKTPILRKLLKVIEYLAAREILTPEHIYGGPPCPGMESFRKSMLSLTEHNDKQVHQIARSFRDRWFPRHGRKYSYMDRDDGRMEFHRGSLSSRVSISQNHLHDLVVKPMEAIDGPIQSNIATAVDSAVHEGFSLPCAGDGTKTRKRKSRWDQPAEEKPSPRSHQHDELRMQSVLQQSGCDPQSDTVKDASDRIDNGSTENSCCPHCVLNYRRQLESNCADRGRQTIQSDVPPGFSSPLDPSLVLPSASSTIADLHQQNGCLMFPVGMVVGHPQKKFISCLSVSYGIPLPIVQQFGLPLDGTAEGWSIAPGMPFHPFPPLPPFPHKNETPSSSAVNSMVTDETTECQQFGQDPANCHPNEKIPTTGSNQPDMDVPGENGQQTFKRVKASSQDLGRRYFRQQKWNKVPPWIRQMNTLGK